MELSTLDYGFLVREWQSLVGGKIQKVYMKDRVHVLDVYTKDKGHVNWLFGDQGTFLTSAKIAWPKEPTGYCLFLRRRLMNARIVSIEQHEADRILLITLDAKEGRVVFLAELFDSINTMLLKDNVIISCFETHSYGERVIRGGVEYKPPKSRTPPWEVPADELVDKHAAKGAATTLGIGGKYAEELCARANIEKNEVLTITHAHTLTEELVKLREAPIAALENGKEALPFQFVTREGEFKPAGSFNEALDLVQRDLLETVAQQDAQQAVRERMTKQEKILSSQRAQLEKIERVALEEQRKGELMYEHYTELKELLDNLKADWKKHSLGEIRDKYGKHPLVKQINEDGTIEVELE